MEVVQDCGRNVTLGTVQGNIEAAILTTTTYGKNCHFCVVEVV